MSVWGAPVSINRMISLNPARRPLFVEHGNLGSEANFAGCSFKLAHWYSLTAASSNRFAKPGNLLSPMDSAIDLSSDGV
jgi:hypothetical protein